MDKYYIKLGRKQVDISDWAKWLGKDPQGLWVEFESKPIKSIADRGWMQRINKRDSSSYRELIETKPPKDWTQEVYQIEREK